jgi:hypothetical protein
MPLAASVFRRSPPCLIKEAPEDEAKAKGFVQATRGFLQCGRPVVCRFSAAGVMAYPRVEAAGGRKAPRHEVAWCWALTGSGAT